LIDIARFSIDRPIYPWLLAFACLLAGIIGIDKIGRLEDPPFPLKSAYVITEYPGASAIEVEQEVTDQIEAALQELPYLDKIISKSVPGRSEVQIDILEEFGIEDTPQIYDELRRRVGEASIRLPTGARVPVVEDDFGDVYGILYAVSATGYSAAERRDIARSIANELKQVEDVAKVEVRGLPIEAVYVELSQQRLNRLGLSIDRLQQGINQETVVTNSGSTRFGDRRLTISAGKPFDDVDAIRNIPIGQAGTTKILKLGDIAKVTRDEIETPLEITRQNGKSVFVVALSVTPGNNVVKVGRSVDKRMTELMQEMPLGVSSSVIYAQHQVVDEAISTFLINLIMSVGTVIAALYFFMGWRAGTVVGLVLFLTVMGTIGLMSLLGIPLQRISLGALMIAMGMLVDNGIVVAEGVVVGVNRGLSPREAASKAVSRTQFALLGATVIGITAFAPISLSNDNTGHFLVSLFQVIAISLLLSWVLAITIVPLFSSYLLKSGTGQSEHDLYSGPLYKPYKRLLSIGLRHAWLTSLVVFSIALISIWGLGSVKQAFFPTTNSPLFYIDYRLAEGTDIQHTSEDVRLIEAKLQEMQGVEAVTLFTGRGPPRFSATMRPEQPNPAYAQLVVRVNDVTKMNRMMQQTKTQLQALRPDAEVQVSRTEFSPAGKSKIEARFSGPDAAVLRRLSGQALDVYLKQGLIDTKTDWRPQSLQLVPEFNDINARIAGVTRQDVARALSYNTLGVPLSLFRDGDKLLPIVARAPADERGRIGQLMDREVWSQIGQAYIPLTQVVHQLTLTAANTTIFRRERERTIIAQANPPKGHNTQHIQALVMEEIDTIALPQGYSLQWGGEYEANIEATTALGSKIPLAFGFMFVITILMFGELRQPIVIWLTVPMIICGVVAGMLITNLPLTFPSFLGVLSLSGMLIKNCIVLIDEIDKRLDEDEMSVQTLLMASISRLRPVLLATGTTIAGMAPLLTDAFFREMAVCIMSGLLFSTLITLIAVPVFYKIALGRKLQTLDSRLGV
jgi:multidrug efflux pump subunit AcrB